MGRKITVQLESENPEGMTLQELGQHLEELHRRCPDPTTVVRVRTKPSMNPLGGTIRKIGVESEWPRT